MSASRRGFLFGRFRADRGALRPPWAIEVGAFEDRCTRCGECIRACPSAIVIAGDGGFPKVDFARGECSFCGDCVSACQPKALRRDKGARAWSLEIAIGDACVARDGVECRVCGEACNEAAVRFRPRVGGAPLPVTDPQRCTGCGACVAPCPADAIEIKHANALERHT